MAKATTDTCCLTLPLRLEKWQSDRLEKRFEIARQIYNTLLRFELKKLDRLKQTEAYKAVIEKLGQPEIQDDPSQKKLLLKQLSELRNKAGFTEYSFKSDIKDFYKHFNDNIGSSVAVHGIAPQVWQAFDRLFYGNGKAVHFKKRDDIKSLRGYSDSKKSGGVEIMFRGTYIEWKGLKLPIKTDPNNAYETDMLTRKVKYCRICKQPGKYKTHWYVQLMLEGKPTVKKAPDTGKELHPIGKGAVGIDIGPQTIAYAAQKECGLLELADRVENIEHQKLLLQRKLDRSRRATNPDNYNEDGTIRRGIRLQWKKSKHYLSCQKELAALQRRQAVIRKIQHNDLANHLLALGDRFIVEYMEWQSLAHRAKKTEISEKTGRYKRKKRFGKSIANKAPSMLITTLDQKLKSRGFDGVTKVPTKLRASQYNHQLDTYQKKELSQRWNDMPDGNRIQRDLYSAFLLQHTNEDQTGFDPITLSQDYPAFVRMHDEVIQHLRHSAKTVASMGITRR